MTANDEFPRGQTITVVTAGQATVTLPAVAGITHVIDEITVRILGTTAANTVVGFIFTTVPGLNLTQTGTVGGTLTTDTDTISGPISGIINSAVTIASGGAVAGVTQILRVTWHDI